MNQKKTLIIKAEPLIKSVELYWRDFLAKENITPHLHVILVGNNSASKIYVQKKSEACARIGLLSTIHRLSEKTTERQLVELITFLNESESCHGILIQAPLPQSFDAEKIFSLLDPKKDVDGFHPYNRGQHLLKGKSFIPCTTLGLTRLLNYYNIDVKGKNIALFGRSAIVGYPTLIELIHHDATVTVYHSKSSLKRFCAEHYDILIFATGQDLSSLAPALKAHQVIIDVGICKKEGKILGDLREHADSLEVSALTPVPGGVGPMTVNSLVLNTITAFLRQSPLERTQLLEKSFLEKTMSFSHQ